MSKREPLMSTAPAPHANPSASALAATSQNTDSSQEDDSTPKKKAWSKSWFCAVFVLGLVLCILAKAGAFTFLNKIRVMQPCDGQDCRGALQVYRVAFALVVFYAVHFLLVLPFWTSPRFRMQAQNSFWLFKVIFFFVVLFLAFLIPNDDIVRFAYFCIFLGAVFVVMQVLILIDLAYTWNDFWVHKEETRYLVGLLIVSAVLYTAGVVLTAFLYIWFGGADCHLNKFFISFTLVLGLLYTGVSMVVKHGALLPSAIVFATSVYWTWSSLFSEPTSESCNTLASSNNGKTSQIVLSVALAIVSLAYTVIKTTGSQAAFTLERKDEADGDQGTLERYWVFHLIMIVASGYASATFTNWSLVDAGDVSSLDEGWTSTWIKIAAVWLSALLYGWSLVAPSILKNRDFGWD